MTAFMAASILAAVAPVSAPIALHPDNPRYLLFEGKPTVLITSGEHYGAVLNSDFDMTTYLDEMQRSGMGLTRTFTGVYCEHDQAFNIARNTLAPAPGALMSPWARSDQNGYANGGAKFDLSRFDAAYFERLRTYVAAAAERGIVVELVLFCPYYGDEQWALSPLNAANNINGIGEVARTDVLTLKDQALVDVELAMVRKVVTELATCGNLYYEICNEPYFGGVTLEWQHLVADTIIETERDLGVQHLIAQNIANGRERVDNPHPGVSIFNFHYAHPPDTVALNAHLAGVIGDDETGFNGTADLAYRTEAWDFIIAGGAIFDHLDYSFAVGTEDGSFDYPDTQPGGGGRELRRQLKILADFMESFDFIAMAPSQEIVTGGVPDGGSVRVLAEQGRQYAVYVRGSGQVTLDLEVPAGTYSVEWIGTLSGEVERAETVEHTGGALRLQSPEFADDCALRIMRTGGDGQ